MQNLRVNLCIFNMRALNMADMTIFGQELTDLQRFADQSSARLFRRFTRIFIRAGSDLAKKYILLF